MKTQNAINTNNFFKTFLKVTSILLQQLWVLLKVSEWVVFVLYCIELEVPILQVHKPVSPNNVHSVCYHPTKNSIKNPAHSYWIWSVLSDKSYQMLSCLNLTKIWQDTCIFLTNKVRNTSGWSYQNLQWFWLKSDKIPVCFWLTKSETRQVGHIRIYNHSD